MKKGIALLLSLTLCIGLFSGCSSTAQNEPGDTPPTATQPVGGSAPVEVKIWHDGDEAIMQTIADQVNSQLEEDGITVTFEKKTDMPSQLKLYGNDPANGPDMYFYAHDVLGTFVAMDILAPLTDVIDTDSVLVKALSLTVEAGQLDETQYLLPVYFETLVSGREISPQRPRTSTTTWQLTRIQRQVLTRWSTNTQMPTMSPRLSTVSAGM